MQKKYFGPSRCLAPSLRGSPWGVPGGGRGVCGKTDVHMSKAKKSTAAPSWGAGASAAFLPKTPVMGPTCSSYSQKKNTSRPPLSLLSPFASKKSLGGAWWWWWPVWGKIDVHMSKAKKSTAAQLGGGGGRVLLLRARAPGGPVQDTEDVGGGGPIRGSQPPLLALPRRKATHCADKLLQALRTS
jgi:hypothetical protein